MTYTTSFQKRNMVVINLLRFKRKSRILKNYKKSILNAFSETHPEINTDSSIEEVQSAWEDFFSKPQELHVNAELSTDEIQSQLEQLASGSSITFNADVDGDGIEDEVKALKNQDGTITYTAEIDGVQKKIEVLQGEDNTLTFNILAEDQATPVIEDVNKRELISKTCALYSEDYATQLIQLWNDASANQNLHHCLPKIKQHGLSILGILLHQNKKKHI